VSTLPWDHGWPSCIHTRTVIARMSPKTAASTRLPASAPTAVAPAWWFDRY
jgi:hypothetical protein